MLLNAAELGLDSEFPVGTLIVGAGTVGLMMAIDLARTGANVVVLEAGPSLITPESQRYFESAESIGRKLEGLHIGRFRALGGTTNFWGGQLVRFGPMVFQRREWLGEDLAWPISRADLDPFYDRALELARMPSAIGDDAVVMDRVGIAPPPADDLQFFLTRWMAETNFLTLFEREFKGLRNLKVVTEAAVVALIADPGGSRVRGVEVLDATQRRRRFLAERVILANGTMEIARLLLLPFADGRRTPWADNRWLGRGFMDHIDCYAGAVAPLNKKAFHLLFDNLRFRGVKYQPKLRLKEDAQRRRRLVDISGHFVFNSSLSEQLADAKVFFKALLRGRLHGSLHDLPQRLRPLASVGAPMIIRYLRYRRIYNYTDGGIQLRLTSEQIMRPNSRLHLLEKKDSLNMPMIAVDWQVDGREFETFRVFAELVKGYLQSAGLANVHLDQRLVNGDPSFLNSLDDANHHMGMTRMSDDADRGVVDRNLRVHRAEGLFVAGAAVFPSTGFANPTFTAIALGLRLSRAIQERIV